MSEALGIHISAQSIVAALADAEGDGDPIILELGEGDIAAAAAVAAGPDGAVLVGDAAARAEGPIVTDPLERARRGRTGALTAVITHVVGRATTALGTAPVKLAVVVGDDFDAEARDQIVAAANAAGFTDVTPVFETVARTRRADVDPRAAQAVGAALTASTAAPPPIVTREDLGHAVAPPPKQPPVVSEPVSGPVSVFDSDEDVEPTPPVRSAPEPVASRPATPPPTATVPSVPPVGPPPAHEVPDRSVPGWVFGLVGLLLVVGAGVAGFVVFGGGDDPDPALTTLTSTSSSTSTTSTTTEAPATSSSTSSTTSSTSSTSSTSTSTSSTSSTSSTTTTTTPIRVAVPGPVTLVEKGLQFDTNVVVQFGQDAEIVLDETAAVLGDPDDDSGFIEMEFCAGTRTRFVRWGNLELVFTEEVADSNEGTFSQWYADGFTDPTGLVTPEGLGVTATVGFLEVTYGSALAIVPAFEGDVVGLFAVTNPGTGGVLSGTTEGLHPEGFVTTLWAGDSCTRAFT